MPTRGPAGRDPGQRRVGRTNGASDSGPSAKQMSAPTRALYSIFNAGPLGRLLKYGPPSPWHRAGLILILLIVLVGLVHDMERSALALWTAVVIFALIFLIVPAGWAYAQYWNRRHPELVGERERKRQSR